MSILNIRFRSIAVVAISSVLLMGCAKKVGYAMQAAGEPLPKVSNMEVTSRQASTLAYEHRLEIEIDKELLTTRVEAVRAACVVDQAKVCTLLEISNQSRNEVPRGSIKVRIAPEILDTLAKLAAEGGRVVNRQTTAEDLAEPIADAERQLTLLNLHRERLMDFMRRKDIAVSDLITVSRELATVQSQLDDYGSQRANLRRRVDTELLTINWSPPAEAFQSAESPVLDAVKSFGANFKEAIAQVITFLAYVLPWLLIGVPAFFLVRWIWVRARARLALRRG